MDVVELTIPSTSSSGHALTLTILIRKFPGGGGSHLYSLFHRWQRKSSLGPWNHTSPLPSTFHHSLIHTHVTGGNWSLECLPKALCWTAHLARDTIT